MICLRIKKNFIIEILAPLSLNGKTVIKVLITSKLIISKLFSGFENIFLIIQTQKYFFLKKNIKFRFEQEINFEFSRLEIFQKYVKKSIGGEGKWSKWVGKPDAAVMSAAMFLMTSREDWV